VSDSHLSFRYAEHQKFILTGMEKTMNTRMRQARSHWRRFGRRAVKLAKRQNDYQSVMRLLQAFVLYEGLHHQAAHS